MYRVGVICLVLVSVGYTIIEPPPPPYKDLIGNARWMVKYANMTMVATQSSFMNGYPFSQNKATADGPYNSTETHGLPYIYESYMATLYEDFQKNSKVTFTYSAAFTHFCRNMNYDNDDPRCGKVMISGEMVEVTDADELEWAKSGIFSRHPATKYWPSYHGFKFYKLKKIENIFALDYFGGASKHLDVEAYLSYKPTWFGNGDALNF